MRRVTFDTNVYISALARKGALRRLLSLAHVDLNVIERDPDDNRILECSQADLIVTSDKDLLDFGVYAGADIIRPGKFLEMIDRST